MIVCCKRPIVRLNVNHPVISDLSNGYCYPLSEQLGPNFVLEIREREKKMSASFVRERSYRSFRPRQFVLKLFVTLD